MSALGRTRIVTFEAGDRGEDGIAELWEADVGHNHICQA